MCSGVPIATAGTSSTRRRAGLGVSSGDSANWANKADLGVVVHRPEESSPGSSPTDIYVRKVRFKSVGRIGVVRLNYDRATGRYSEPAGARHMSSAPAYRDD